MEKVYNKLVRDNIPNIIIKNGATPIYYKLNNEQYWEYLLKKDQEELEEVRTATNIDEIRKELADKLEVLRSMAEYNNLDLSEVIMEADIKKQKNGGFNNRILLEKVIE